MIWPTLPLKELAPAETSNIRFSPDEPVWHLTLDQIASHTGYVVSRKIAPASEAGTSTYAFDEGNVLYSKLRPYLNKVLCPTEPGIATTELVPLRPRKDILDRRYLTYYLRSSHFLGFANVAVAGVKMPRLIMPKFWKHQVPLPPLSEQRHLVEILDQADVLRRKRAEADGRAARILPALFYKMFGDPATNPHGLPTQTLEQVTSIIYRYPTFYGVDYLADGVPVVRIGDIQENHILNRRIEDYVRVPQDFSNQYPLTILTPFDTVMAVRGDTTGKIGLVPIELAGANISPNLIRISPQRDRVLPIYLFAYLLIARSVLRQFITNTAKKSITAKNLKTIPVLLPGLEQQRHFHTMLMSVLDLEQKRLRARQNIEALFRVLMHRAFTGDLTAKWRESHMKELLAEMEQKSRYMEK